MKITPALARLFTLRHLRSDLLPWAIALAVGIDYFDNTIFSFFTSYIAGGINASPDELVWSSTAYATASVLGIVQQQWLIERLGFRRYLSGCLLMFAAGSLAASLSESSLSRNGAWPPGLFHRADARHLPHHAANRFHAAGPCARHARLPGHDFARERARADGRRLSRCILRLARAVHVLDNWRAALSAFAFLVVPHIGKRPVERRSGTHLWPYLLFAVALGALQIVAQQLRFEVFSTTPLMPLATVAG